MRRKQSISVYRYSLIFILVMLMALSVTLPVKLLATWAPPYTGEVKLYDYYGTLLNGGAHLVVYENRVIGGVEWDLNFISLLEGRVVWDLTVVGDKEITATVRGGVSFFGRELVESLYLDLPVRKATAFLHREVASLDGRVIVDLVELDINRDYPQFSVAGSVKVNGLQIGRGVDIGSFTAAIDKENEGSKIVFQSRGKGTVGANIIIFIDPAGKYRVEGSAEANENAGAAVKTALAWVGKRKGGNKFVVKSKGDLWSLIGNVINLTDNP